MRGAGLTERSRHDQDTAEVPLVRIGGAGRHDLAHPLARQDLDVGPLDLVQDRQRDPDVRDHEVSRVRVGGRQHERDLRRRERHGHRRFNRFSLHLVAVGRKARREVDRDDRHAEAVQVRHDGLEQAAQLPLEPRAKDRVHDQLALRDLAEVQLPLLRVRDFDDGQADASEHLEIRAGIAAHVRDAPEQEH